MPACESLTVNQLAMDKPFAINNLRSAGYSERRIAQTLGVSRGAVRRHLRCPESNSTKAPTGSGDPAPTGAGDSNGTKTPTGSDGETVASAAVAVAVSVIRARQRQHFNAGGELSESLSAGLGFVSGWRLAVSRGLASGSRDREGEAIDE